MFWPGIEARGNLLRGLELARDLKFYVLSTRHFIRLPGNGCATELEDLLVDCCQAQLLAPAAQSRSPFQLLRILGWDRRAPMVLEGDRHERVLLVVGLWTQLLSVILELPHWRREFGLVAGYVIDPWGAWKRRPLVVPRQFDMLFVPDVRVAEQFHRVHRFPCRAVPLAADVLGFGCNSLDRPLDVVAYGRQDPGYVQALEAAFNDPRSRRFFYHDTLAAARVTNFQSNRRLIWKLLHKSRCALAFDTLMAPGERAHDRSILPIRYYEAVAAGTALVGIHPDLPEMSEQFDWPDATIDLPGRAADAVPFLESLLEDQPRLHAIHRRNYAQARLRHDWRYRVQTMLETLGLPLPLRLQQQLAQLRRPLPSQAEVPGGTDQESNEHP